MIENPFIEIIYIVILIALFIYLRHKVKLKYGEESKKRFLFFSKPIFKWPFIIINGVFLISIFCGVSTIYASLWLMAVQYVDMIAALYCKK